MLSSVEAQFREHVKEAGNAKRSVPQIRDGCASKRALKRIRVLANHRAGRQVPAADVQLYDLGIETLFGPASDARRIDRACAYEGDQHFGVSKGLDVTDGIAVDKQVAFDDGIEDVSRGLADTARRRRASGKTAVFRVNQLNNRAGRPFMETPGIRVIWIERWETIRRGYHAR